MSGPCAECGGSTPTSPSDYFCSDACQQHWHTKRTIGYPSPPELATPRQLGQVVRRWQAVSGPR